MSEVALRPNFLHNFTIPGSTPYFNLEAPGSFIQVITVYNMPARMLGAVC